MSDISNLLIKDSYDYVIQVDPVTREVLRIGGSVPNNPIFLSGLTVFNSFRFSNKTESAGYFLKCDALGNASWQPGNISGNTYALTGVTADGFTLNFYDSEGQTITVDITGGTLSFLNVTGDTIVKNLSGDSIYVNQIYLSGYNIDDIYLKKVCLPAIISGKVDKTSFSGQPYTYEIILPYNLPDTNYSITVTGFDVRVWSIENQTISGFTINTNSNVNPKNDTFWQVISINTVGYSGSCVCTNNTPNQETKTIYNEGNEIPSATNVDDYPLSDFTFFKISGTTQSNINGFSGGVSGRFIMIVNNTDKNQTIIEESLSSLPSNRFFLGGSNKIIGINSTASFLYTTNLTIGGVGGQSRWILTSST